MNPILGYTIDSVAYIRLYYTLCSLQYVLMVVYVAFIAYKSCIRLFIIIKITN